MQRFIDVLRDETGAAVADAEVRIYVGNSETLAELYDGAGDPVAQPLTTNASGVIINGSASSDPDDALGFRATAGRYRILATKGGASFALPGVELGALDEVQSLKQGILAQLAVDTTAEEARETLGVPDADGWAPAVAAAYVSASSFTVASDADDDFHVGRRVRVVGDSTGTVYGTVSGVSGSAPKTVTVRLDSGALAAEALTVSVGSTRAEKPSVPGAGVSGIYHGGTTALTLAAYIEAGDVLPEMFGAVGGDQAKDSAAIRAAITYAAARGLTVRFGARRYLYDGTPISTNNVSIAGRKRPVLNGAGTALEFGSIIVGTLKLTGKNPTVRNIGIDHGLAAFPASPENALSLSAAGGPSAGGMATVEDVISLCAAPSDPYHAILVEGYTDTTISDVIGINAFYALAVKAVRANISGVIAKRSGVDGIILKSDSQFGDASYINLSNVVVEGVAGTTSNFIRVMSFDDQIERVNISNVSGTGATRGLYVDVNGSTGVAINELNVSNFSAHNVTTGVLLSAGAGVIYSTRLTNLNAVNVGGRVMELTGNCHSVSVDGLFGSLSASSPNVADAIDVGSSVTGFRGDNIELLVNYSRSSLAGIEFNNSYANNWLSNFNCSISGVGIPRPGFSEPAIGGVGQTLTPTWDGRNNESFIRAVPAAGAEVSGITREMPNGVRFPRGYRLTIVNDSLNALVIKHNPATGWIYNRGAADFTLQSQEAVTYVFSSAIWHMTS